MGQSTVPMRHVGWLEGFNDDDGDGASTVFFTQLLSLIRLASLNSQWKLLRTETKNFLRLALSSVSRPVWGFEFGRQRYCRQLKQKRQWRKVAVSHAHGEREKYHGSAAANEKLEWAAEGILSG